MNNLIKFLITSFVLLLVGLSFASATDVDDNTDIISSTDIELSNDVYSEQTNDEDISTFTLTTDESGSDLISDDETSFNENDISYYLPSEGNSTVPSSNDIIYISTNTTMEVPVGEIGKPITLTARVSYYDMEESYPLDYGVVYFVLADNNVVTNEYGNTLYVPVKDGVASVTTIASSNWINTGNRIIKAKYPTFEKSSDEAYLVSESDFVELRVYDKLYNTKVSMEPVSGAIGDNVIFDVTVDTDEDGVAIPVTDGYVTFSINDNYIITDPNNAGEPLKLDVVNGTAFANITADINWLFIDHDYIRVNYTGESEYLDSISDKVSLKLFGGIIDELIPDSNTSKPINKLSNVDKSFNKHINTKDNYNEKTFKVIVNNNVIYDGTVITLDTLNKIFDSSFINGILVVYLDGKIVFNGTTTDDLSLVIFEIIESLIDQHELKVEFIDSNNKTYNYTEIITIK